MLNRHFFLTFFLAPHFFLSSLFLSSSANAQGQDLWEKSLEELLNVKVVSGTRKEDVSFKLPMVITVLSRQELQRWGGDNLADGLRVAAGVQIRKAPGDFPQHKAVIRGNTSDFMNIRTLFLIDGVPVQNPNAGFDPGWIPLSMVERVEIVRGPVSGIYGANAFGGLVNVITRSGRNSEGSLGEGSLGVRSFRDVSTQQEVVGQEAALDLKGSNDQWDYFATTQYSGAKNIPQSFTGFQARDVFGKLEHRASEKMTYSLRSLVSSDQNYLALSNSDSPMQNDFLHLAGSAHYRFDNKSELDVTAYLNEFKHFAKYNDALENYENRGQAYGGHIQWATSPEESHILTSGFEFSEFSGYLQTKSYDYSNFPPAVVVAGWDKDKHSAYGVYSQYEYTGWNQYMPLISLRYDKESAFGGAVSPRLGCSYLVSNQATLYLSVGRGFRAPIFNETRINGYGKVGNPSLNPEYTSTYEVGLKTVHESLQNNLSIFNQYITKQISLVSQDPLDPNSLKTYQNSGTGMISGVELDGSYKFSPAFRLSYNGSVLRSDDGTGKRIERVIEQKMVLILSWLQSDWKTDFVTIHEGNHFFFNTNNAIPNDSEGRVFLPAVTTMNLQTAYNWSPKTSLTFFMNNLTDQKYKESFSSYVIEEGFWLPGRGFGLRLNSQF